MNSDVLNKLDEIIELIDNNEDVKIFKSLKKELLKDNELLNDIDLIKNNKVSYGNEYVALKEKVISNDKFKVLKSIENDLYFFVQEINLKFKNMLKEVKNENN